MAKRTTEEEQLRQLKMISAQMRTLARGVC